MYYKKNQFFFLFLNINSKNEFQNYDNRNINHGDYYINNNNNSDYNVNNTTRQQDRREFIKKRWKYAYNQVKTQMVS